MKRQKEVKNSSFWEKGQNSVKKMGSLYVHAGNADIPSFRGFILMNFCLNEREN